MNWTTKDADAGGSPGYVRHVNTFAPGLPALLLALAISVCLAYVTWTGVREWCEGNIRFAIEQAPSPFAIALAGGPWASFREGPQTAPPPTRWEIALGYGVAESRLRGMNSREIGETIGSLPPASAPDKERTDLLRNYLCLALENMDLRSNGEPLTRAALHALADKLLVVYGLVPQKDGSGAPFASTALETVTIFVQHWKTLNSGGVLSDPMALRDVKRVAPWWLEQWKPSAPPASAKSEPVNDSTSRKPLIDNLVLELEKPASITHPEHAVAMLLATGHIQEKLADLLKKVESADGLPSPGKDPNLPDDKFAFQNWPVIYQIFERTMQMVQVDPKVRNARFLLTFFDGIDQFVMYIIFYYIIGLFCLRFAKRWWVLHQWSRFVLGPLKAGEPLDQVELALPPDSMFNVALTHYRKVCGSSKSMIAQLLEAAQQGAGSPDWLIVRGEFLRQANQQSRWLLGWCGRALPTVGFVGKVFGIAYGMKDADAIARAVGPYAQSAAIQQVASALGVAFTATFSAFILGLFVSYLDALQGRKENKAIDRMEETLLTAIQHP